MIALSLPYLFALDAGTLSGAAGTSSSLVTLRVLVTMYGRGIAVAGMAIASLFGYIGRVIVSWQGIRWPAGARPHIRTPFWLAAPRKDGIPVLRAASIVQASAKRCSMRALKGLSAIVATARNLSAALFKSSEPLAANSQLE
ncbi:hypothetical protein [Achromobacter xylosoxidans]|uniref:hypothetical protein n=1 Tax=Alcaligenes xylosoxydans xylosoxydans TaxID=85698 RepID=UPI001F13787D|nr:hypothetical protein [Achromobacter xylosoxidans]